MKACDWLTQKTYHTEPPPSALVFSGVTRTRTSSFVLSPSLYVNVSAVGEQVLIFKLLQVLFFVPNSCLPVFPIPRSYIMKTPGKFLPYVPEYVPFNWRKNNDGYKDVDLPLNEYESLCLRLIEVQKMIIKLKTEIKNENKDHSKFENIPEYINQLTKTAITKRQKDNGNKDGGLNEYEKLCLQITEVRENINKLKTEIKNENIDPSKLKNIPDEDTNQLTKTATTKRQNEDSSFPPASEKKPRLNCDSVPLTDYPLPNNTPSDSDLQFWKSFPISFKSMF